MLGLIVPSWIPKRNLYKNPEPYFTAQELALQSLESFDLMPLLAGEVRPSILKGCFGAPLGVLPLRVPLRDL